MNTQNIKELENSQNKIVQKYEATLLTGIVKGYINTEDSIPTTTVLGKFDKQSGLEFAQQLANAMDINVLVNRIETWYAKDESVLHLIYDIKANYTNDNQPIPTNQSMDERYGVKVSPQISKKLKM